MERETGRYPKQPGHSGETGPVHFSITAFGNPGYIEDQSRVIREIKVGTPEDVLPADIYLHFTTDYGDKDPFEINLSDGSRVKMHTDPVSDIVTIRVMKPRIRWPKLFSILAYYQVDNVTQKAWNVAQLWQERDGPPSGSKSVQVFNLPIWLNAMFSPAFKILILNQWSVDHWLGRFFRLQGREGAREFAITDAIIPAHESGHRWQFQDHVSQKDLPRFTCDTRLKARMLPVIERWFPVWGAVVREELTTIKRHFVQLERNADAFVFGAIRHLRSLGVDLLRGYPTADVHQVIDKQLRWKDEKFRHFPGLSFSNEFRKRDRKRK